MKPFFVLLIVFSISVVVFKLIAKEFYWKKAGKIALAVMFAFASIGHFIYPNGMAAMFPNFFPAKTFLVYASGVLEICFAIGLFIPKISKITAWAILIFLVFALPLNINAAAHHINYQTGELNGKGLDYLWIRIPIQLFYIGWTYFFTIREKS